jgi:hypothetical protein
MDTLPYMYSENNLSFLFIIITRRPGNFSLHHRVQNGSGAHPASYPMGTKGSFPGG